MSFILFVFDSFVQLFPPQKYWTLLAYTWQTEEVSCTFTPHLYLICVVLSVLRVVFQSPSISLRPLFDFLTQNKTVFSTTTKVCLAFEFRVKQMEL